VVGVWADLVGQRVVVRRVVGERDGRPLFSDVIGELVSGDDPLTVRRTDGSMVRVDAGSVHRIKPIPGRRPDPLELEEIAAAGWPAAETRWLGRWLLRAADGWTGRANSVLPLGDPGEPLDVAVESVRRWYADRGLAARFQVPLPVATGLDAELADRGFRADPPVLVQTAALPTLLARATDRTDLPEVVFDETPSSDWLAAYHYRGGSDLPAVAVGVMTAARLPVFASVVIDGETVAVARAVVDEGWLGVTAVEVSPAWRRRGLASHVMRGLARWGTDHDATQSYLQVASDNHAAVAFYERLGYTTHHRYHYRIAD
jgi:GNAT superfamily N-acetyltransferase